MKTIQQKPNVALNLNEELLTYANYLLNRHAAINPQSPFDIVCDLPQLCRDLCLAILHYLWEHKCKKHKTRTAEICCIHRDTVRNYENYIEP